MSLFAINKIASDTISDPKLLIFISEFYYSKRVTTKIYKKCILIL